MSNRGAAPASRSGRTRIKICGITTVEDARAAVRAGADAVGLVFAADSPRRVLPGAAIRIARELPPFVTAIGVFRDPSDAELQNWRGAWVQIHGREDAPQLARVAQQHRSIIRGFEFERNALRRFDGDSNVVALLVDGSSGGAGRAFEHEELARSMPDLTKPVIVAGGLTPENVGAAIAATTPFAVDVSSGVESAEGVKDPDRIIAFCEEVRRADAEATS